MDANARSRVLNTFAMLALLTGVFVVGELAGVAAGHHDRDVVVEQVARAAVAPAVPPPQDRDGAPAPHALSLDSLPPAETVEADAIVPVMRPGSNHLEYATVRQLRAAIAR